MRSTVLGFVKNVVIVGCGGIGGWLMPPLARFLEAEGFDGRIHIWDGDIVAEHNRSRQDFDGDDINANKAEVVCARVMCLFGSLQCTAHSEFIVPANVQSAVPEDSLVFTCVDNHPCRVLIDKRAAVLNNVCIISAGNELTDGNVHVYLRRSGVDCTDSFLSRHPESTAIEVGDRNGISCEELLREGEPQILFTNLWAAVCALTVFYQLYRPPEVPAGKRRRTALQLTQELYFDLRQGAAQSIPMIKAKEAACSP